METKLNINSFARILKIMDELREQCPWDKKQTLDSLRILTIEEAYELSDAIVQKDMEELKKELGDVFLHLLFYSRIASEQKAFDINDVVDTLAEKLIRRHPHIYGEVNADNEEQVKQNWEKIKQTERKKEKGVMSGVPASLPSMVKAFRIQEKAAAVGFDWEHTAQVVDKVKEELEEWMSAVRANNKEESQKEFGDLIFALVNVARFLKINPDDALEQTNRKFLSRFAYIEDKLKETKKEFSDVDLQQMDRYWNEAKSKEL